MPDPTVAFDFMHAAGLCYALVWMVRAHATGEQAEWQKF